MSRFYIISSIALIVLLSSCGGKKQESAADPPPCFSDEAMGVTPTYNATSQPTETSTSQSTSSGSLNNISTMSREEDAYEEGRALREEDRLNGTRQHEGDDYDEGPACWGRSGMDYDDDYDEGPALLG